MALERRVKITKFVRCPICMKSLAIQYESDLVDEATLDTVARAALKQHYLHDHTSPDSGIGEGAL